ncbi:leiomodin-1 isoform X2 [Engraulis encrasicolus]|uniref:leiomodin-1 isoform X2 n=1 Tax=Engraulis encrasicolus TaxID=184585 RepID=UPI002FD78DD3
MSQDYANRRKTRGLTRLGRMVSEDPDLDSLLSNLSPEELQEVEEVVMKAPGPDPSDITLVEKTEKTVTEGAGGDKKPLQRNASLEESHKQKYLRQMGWSQEKKEEELKRQHSVSHGNSNISDNKMATENKMAASKTEPRRSWRREGSRDAEVKTERVNGGRPSEGRVNDETNDERHTTAAANRRDATDRKEKETDRKEAKDSKTKEMISKLQEQKEKGKEEEEGGGGYGTLGRRRREVVRRDDGKTKGLISQLKEKEKKEKEREMEESKERERRKEELRRRSEMRSQQAQTDKTKEEERKEEKTAEEEEKKKDGAGKVGADKEVKEKKDEDGKEERNKGKKEEDASERVKASANGESVKQNTCENDKQHKEEEKTMEKGDAPDGVGKEEVKQELTNCIGEKKVEEEQEEEEVKKEEKSNTPKPKTKTKEEEEEEESASMFDEDLQRVRDNDPNMAELNVNNSEVIKVKTLMAFAEALRDNTHIKSFALANCRADDHVAYAIAGTLRVNKTLTSVNMDSNLLTSKGIMSLIQALQYNASLTELRFHNQRHICGGKSEMEMTKILKDNTTLLKLGYHFELAGPRMTMTNILSRNMDRQRQRRLQEQKQAQQANGGADPKGALEVPKTKGGAFRSPKASPKPSPQPSPMPSPRMGGRRSTTGGSGGPGGPPPPPPPPGGPPPPPPPMLDGDFLKNSLKPVANRKSEGKGGAKNSRDQLLASIRGSDVKQLKKVPVPKWLQ